MSALSVPAGLTVYRTALTECSVNIGYSKLYAVSNPQDIGTALSVVAGLLCKVLSVGIDWTTWQRLHVPSVIG